MSINTVRTVLAKPVEDRRHDINRFGGQINTPRGTPRHPDHQRHTKGGVQIVDFAPAAKIAKHLAMIRGDDNQRVLILNM